VTTPTERTTQLVAAFLLTLPLACAHAQFDHEHKAWAALLNRHVVLIDGGKASQVRYDGFARDRAALRSYLRALSSVSQQQFAAWTKAQRMAFLINAYNAFTIEKVLSRYPDIQSIWDFGKLLGNPFKDEFFELFGEPYSLDRIEHDTLRKPGVYDEPRIHFAVNCASIGCPMLREEAYVAPRLDTQLEEQTRRFLSDRTRNRFDPAARRLELSQIFQWYEIDWTSGYRGLDDATEPIRSREQFLARYADLLAAATQDRELIRSGKAPLAFLDYDWELNAARR